MTVENVPDPVLPGPEGVIVTVERTAICGSDLHLYHDAPTGAGIQLGHEAIGTVAEVGPHVRNLKRGDSVLVSGVIAYRASARHGWLPARGSQGWWQPGVNLLGCIFFGISAIAGYVVPTTGSIVDLAAANVNTALGAACFLACALATLRSGSTFKRPVLHELEVLGGDLERDVGRLV